jgi:ABC-type sugar transport system ATPase subunit
VEYARAHWISGGLLLLSFLPPHRRPLGYVFQGPSLFPHLSVRRNLEYGLKRLPAVARRVSLEHAVELLDLGPLLQRKPHQLSGGEQQRVAIARALAVSPELLLMDEPLAALDQTRREEILPYLESLHRELGFPLLYVSHARDEVVRLSDHLLLMEQGRVRTSGPVAELFSSLEHDLAHRTATIPGPACAAGVKRESGLEPRAKGTAWPLFQHGESGPKENPAPMARAELGGERYWCREKREKGVNGPGRCRAMLTLSSRRLR